MISINLNKKIRIQIKPTLLLFLTFIFSILISCSESKKLKIEFDDVSGLNENTKVSLGGIDIGKVKKMSVQNNAKILVEIKLEKELELTKDSKFQIFNNGLFHSSEIKIENGRSKEMLDFRKIQKGSKQKEIINDSTLINISKDLIHKISSEPELDSIYKQLLKLNENIEKRNTKNDK